VSSPFAVSWWNHLLSGWVHHCPRFWLALARLESQSLGKALDLPIAQPLFVCGLARSGSTLLHEVLSAHPSVATHRVKDYPFVFTPYWWRKASAGRRPTPPQERAHGDRMLIHSDSPEALEEMLWMAYFPSCHDPRQTNVLTRDTSTPAFEDFYRTHLRKVMYSERRTRYAAKANYHVARLAYLHRLFPDARFVLPIREPTSHIASLMRQHERFSAAGREYPRSLASLQRIGHFEFGLDRRPIHLGDGERVKSIVQLWVNDEEVRGWARYWAMVHGYLWDLLEAEEELRAASLVVRFEDMCAQPHQNLRTVLAHAGLSDSEAIVQQFASTIRPPDYYEQQSTTANGTIIAEETGIIAKRWGFSPNVYQKNS